MSLPSFSVKNTVLVNMMMLVILVGGTMLSFNLVREMFPESRPNQIAIAAVYPGVQPAEIEKTLTIKIEEAVRDVEGVEKVYSTISEGLTTTRIFLLNEVEDVDVVHQEIKSRIDSLQDVPDDVEQIRISKIEPRLPVISVALYGDGDESDMKRAANKLRDDLLMLPGISDVEISGSRNDEISIEILPHRLQKYNVTFDQVAQAIRSKNLDISGGQLKGERVSQTVRVIGEENRGRALEDLVVVSQGDGEKVYLRDLAEIQDNFVESDLESYFNDKPAMNCTVYKTASQDAIQIAKLIQAYTAGKTGAEFDPYGMKKALQKPWHKRPFAIIGAKLSKFTAKISGRPDPQKVYEESAATPFNHNFEVKLHTDLSQYVSGRLDLMTRNGKTGLVLVLLSLYLFLNPKVAFWAAIGLPVSFLGTFIVMYWAGISMNLLSMFGLIIVLGIIVDDAIVIGENIFRQVEEGVPPMVAAVKGAEEVLWPVTVAILTTIAAFAPLLFVKGQIGDFMGQLPIVVLAALLVSLVEALVILPAHLAHLKSKEEMDAAREKQSTTNPLRVWGNRFAKARDHFMQDVLMDGYEKFLRLSVRWRYVTIAVSFSALIISLGMLAGGIVETMFIQPMDSETLVCELKMPVGTTADNTRQRLLKISQKATQMEEVESVQMFVAKQYDLEGAGTIGDNDASHLGQLVIELKTGHERETRKMRSSTQILQELREVSESLTGVNSVSWNAMNGGPGGNDIEVQVTGLDFDEVVEVVDLLKEELSSYEGVFDLDDDYDEGQREIQLELKKTSEPTGVTVTSLGMHVRSAMFGQEARRLSRNREDVKIMVRYPERYRTNIYHLESMRIPVGGTPNDRSWVPIKELAKVDEAQSYSTIHRSQRQRSVTIFGDIDTETANTKQILQRVEVAFHEKIKPKYSDVRILFLGQTEEMGKAFGGLKIAFPVALLLIFMLLAALFRSYMQPVVVMSAIPFGLMGAIIGHWVTGNPMTVMSWIGMVALTGILVNDSLVLVDFINKRVANGMDEFEASVQGAKLRLRAILLTTLTTAAGLMPLMFETSFQAKFLIPMAVTLTFGLIFATALTLVIVPSLNMIFFDVRRLIGKQPHNSHEETSEGTRVSESSHLSSSEEI